MMPYRGRADDFARTIVRQPNLPATLNTTVAHASHTIPGEDEAAITIKRGRGTYETVAVTGDLPGLVDTIQYQTGEARAATACASTSWFTPTIQQLMTGNQFRLARHSRTGLTSTLSDPLYVEDEETLGAGRYSKKPAAFTTTSVLVLNSLTTQRAIVVAKANAEERSEHLHAALRTNRTIGTAVGILMATYKTTEQQGSELLRMASQNDHRELRDVAQGVVETGMLALVLDPR
ncbi:ANTAR domain-containing protein [Jatrophihabitans sp. DSM 45814]